MLWKGSENNWNSLLITIYDVLQNVVFYFQLYWDRIDIKHCVSLRCTTVDLIHLYIKKWLSPLH